MTQFLNQALIFVTFSVILVPISQSLGLGSVVGYFLGGILIGPHLLGLISHSEAVMHFSEIGILFLLFVIGLELQPKKLWALRGQLVGLGLLQLFACTLLFTSFFLLMGLHLRVSTILAFALSLSSTAFAVQTLREKNLMNSEFGGATFSVLLMQDIAAIPALAMVPALAHVVESDKSHSIPFLIFLGITGGLVLVNKWILTPSFRYLAKLRSRELFTMAGLFVVLAVSLVMLKLGLSAALGTFIAGVLLADSEFRHELEANIEPFKSLLMGLFFIGVGMGVGLDLLIHHPFKVIFWSSAYLLTKIAMIYGVGRLGRLNHENAKRMAINIGQGGEFAFVIFGLIAQYNWVPGDLLQWLTSIIAVSMILCPILIYADERMTQRCRPLQDPTVYDTIDENHVSIIIAGFGRFGQMFGRILRAQNIPYVAIDHDVNQINLLRKFNTKVYYGDASRLDLLQAAGAGNAKYFILAIDDVDDSLKTAKILREHFPHLKIFARARNRAHVFDLLELGITHIKRETLDSSVSFAQSLLIDMGYEKANAEQLIHKFTEHDELLMLEQFKVKDDDKQLVSLSTQGQDQLAAVFKAESTQYLIRAEKAPPKSEST